VAGALERRVAAAKGGALLLPLVEGYLRASARERGPTVDAATYEELARVALAPPRYRGASFSASGVSNCMRRQVLQFLDAPTAPRPTDTTWESLLLDGHWRHLRWQACFLQLGIVARDEDGRPLLEVPIELPEHRVRGTVDAILELDGERWVCDIKGAHEGSFALVQQGQVPRMYLWQLMCYQLGTGLDNAMMFVECKGDQRLAESHLRPDPAEWGVLRARLRGLNRHLDLRRLPNPLAEFPKGECRRCPYQAGCLTQRFTEDYALDDAPI
jgi:hypothetical protein